MARHGTALTPRPEDPSADRPGGAASLRRRLTGALDRRDAAVPGRRGRARSRGALAEKLAEALERQLARAVERRLGGGRASDRSPGPLERRIVAALERRLSAGRLQPLRPAGRGGRMAEGLERRRPGGDLTARRETTLQALVLRIFAHSVVRALTVILRVLGRGLVSGPMRRLAGLLARRAVRARPTGQLGLLALLLGAIALAYRSLVRRAAGGEEVGRAAFGVLRRLLAALVSLVGRLLARLRRTLGPAVRRGRRQATAARRRR